ncbi:hypothetical protein [Roseiconus lacunae]|uniref:Helix-turn-helix domain-containing protein n=1 Tax=Roseiconus lacunae TaxID=2605694 RepID=A0ABT7PFM1_9BACT|nr:hypothetical protein [Roseiconus lacunae]MDM4015285.1 hypothetical protein [Roseiconus lacunae]
MLQTATQPRLKMPPVPFFTIAMASKLTGCRRLTIAKWVDRGVIKSHRVKGWPFAVIHVDQLDDIKELKAKRLQGRRTKPDSSSMPTGLVPIEDAAKFIGTSYQHLSNLGRQRWIKLVQSDGRLFVRNSDLESARVRFYAEPLPGDPTPEEITQRCKEVRQQRCRRSDAQDDHVAQLILDVLSQGAMTLGRLHPAVGLHKEFHKMLARLIESGRVIKSTFGVPLYAIAGSDPSLESSDAILHRFRRRACDRGRRRCVAA